jgi:hypothetical protein
MPHNSGPTKRDMFDSHGAGKGDSDRSPGWREHYDDIDWGAKNIQLAIGSRRTYEPAGFREVSPGVRRKVYGSFAPKRQHAGSSDWRKPATSETPILAEVYYENTKDRIHQLRQIRSSPV